MPNKSNMPAITLGIICLILAIAVFSLFQYSNLINKTLKRRQDEFSAKLSEYKRSIESLQAAVDEKVRAIAEAEDKVNAVERQMGLIKEENEKAYSTLNSQRKILLRKHSELVKRMEKFEKASLESLITETLEKEANRDIKMVLADALAKVELMRAGKPVGLEPIVVTKPAGAEAEREAVSASGEPNFMIVALDRKNRLIAINGGRKDNIATGDTVAIVKSGKEIGSAEVVAVRYRASSAFVGSLRQGYSMKDVEEGTEVAVAAK